MTTCVTCGRTRQLVPGETYRYFWPCGCSLALPDLYEHRPVIAGEERRFIAHGPDANGGVVVADHPTRDGAIAQWRAALPPYEGREVVTAVPPTPVAPVQSLLRVGDNVSWRTSGSRDAKQRFGVIVEFQDAGVAVVHCAALGAPIGIQRHRLKLEDAPTAPVKPAPLHEFKVGDEVTWLTIEKQERRSGVITKLCASAVDGCRFAEITRHDVYGASACVNTRRLRDV